MTTDLEQRLRDALREDAERARLANPDGPPAPEVPQAVIHVLPRRWPRQLVAVAAVIALVAVVAAVALQDDDQAVDTTPATEAPVGPEDLAWLELAGTLWTFVSTSDGPVTSDMEFNVYTVSWDTGCERKGASYELDRDDGVLDLTNVETLSGTCGPPTTFGNTGHYPVIDAVMRAGRIPIKVEAGRLYLGDHPDGAYLVLEPLVDGQPEPPSLPEPGEQPANATAAQDEIRDVFLAIFDTTGDPELRAQLSEEPAVWLNSARGVAAGPNWELVQSLSWQVHEVVFVDPTHAAVSFGYTSDEGMASDFIGDALLVDGRWVVAIRTSCELFDLTGNSCDMSLAG